MVEVEEEEAEEEEEEEEDEDEDVLVVDSVVSPSTRAASPDLLAATI